MAPEPDPPDPTPPAPRTRDLSDDMAGTRSAPAGDARKWPGRTIRYYETIPKKWDWNLRQAVKAWNGAGGRIRFVKAPRGRAQLRISYGDTGGADGVGTLGYTRNAYVHLSYAYKRTSPTNAVTRAWVGRLFTHELGHVLGFGHTAGRCSLMVPIFNLGTCPVLSVEKPGYYACRWIDKPMLDHFIRRYGGRAKRPPRDCPLAPLPPELGSLTAEAPAGAPVRISWKAPAGRDGGDKVAIQVWKAATCATPPKQVEEYLAKVDRASWADPVKGLGPHCYQVSVQNRYGAARPPVVFGRARWAPVPAAPQVSPPVWDRDEYAFRTTWAAPVDTRLEMVTDLDAPTRCLPAYDPNQARWLEDEAGQWLLPVNAPSTCVTLFAVTEWGTVSGGTTLVLEVPLPPAPTVGSTVTKVESSYDQFEVAALRDPVWDLPRVEVRPGACPSAAPGDAGWSDGWSPREGVLQFSAEAEGQNCAILAFVDGWRRPGPVEMRPFTWTPEA